MTPENDHDGLNVNPVLSVQGDAADTPSPSLSADMAQAGEAAGDIPLSGSPALRPPTPHLQGLSAAELDAVTDPAATEANDALNAAEEYTDLSKS